MRSEMEEMVHSDIFTKVSCMNQIGLNILTNKEVAIKIEEKFYSSNLLDEYKILMYLQGEEGIPKTHLISSAEYYNIMVLELLGPNLSILFDHYRNYFTLKTVLIIADQMISRLELVHSRYFIHRDIKPENFIIGLGSNKNTIYLIDYGLSKRFRSNKTAEHIPYKDGKSLCGTARYASIYTHLGIEQSRRDDLESLGYTLMYFLRGDLPWQGIKGKTIKEKYLKIMETKIESLPEILCKGFPEELSQFFQYCRSLHFEEKPDYNYLRGLFHSISKNNYLSRDNILFDWDKIKSEDQYSVDLNLKVNRNLHNK